jgi:hypothetical protein
MAAPTVRQVYALAAALCERMGEEFPETREAASSTIERLRVENGHPAPSRDETPLPRGGRRRRRNRGREDREAGRAAAELVEEMM